MRSFVQTALSLCLLLLVCPALVMSAPETSAETAAVTDSASAAVEAAAEMPASGFAYHPLGRRDPFRPLVSKEPVIVPKTVSARPEAVKGPLEKFELNQFQLQAIMVVGGVPRAMVKGPDKKSYTVKAGDYIGLHEGQIVKIEPQQVEIRNGQRVELNPDRIVVREVGIEANSGKEVRKDRTISM